MTEGTPVARDAVALELMKLVIQYDTNQMKRPGSRAPIEEDELLRLYARCLQTIKDCKVPTRHSSE